MPNPKQFETRLLRPVRGGVVALIGVVGAGACLAVFTFDLQLISEIDINALLVSFVLCGLGAGLGFILLYRLLPERPPISLFGWTGVRLQRQIRIETSVQAMRDHSAVGEPQSRSQNLAIPADAQPEKISRYKTPENSAIFAFLAIILMSAALSPRVPLGWEFLCVALLAGSTLALIMHWRERGSNDSNYVVPVGGGAVASAAMIGLGMVMMRFPFLRVFLEVVLGAGAVIAATLHWLHSRNREAPFV
jgi:hypothetical protein